MLRKLKKASIVCFIGLLILTLSCETAGSGTDSRGNNGGKSTDAMMEELLDRIALLESENSALADQNSQFLEEIFSLERDVSRLGARNDFLEKALDGNEREISRLEREIGSLEREINRNSNTGLILNIILISFNVIWALVNKFYIIDKVRNKIKEKKSKKAEQSEQQEHPEQQELKEGDKLI
jgi:septal ring factor EnvC (AmiA/AmiB activator)